MAFDRSSRINALQRPALAGMLASSLSLCAVHSAFAAGEVTSVIVLNEGATPTLYTAEGTDYLWGITGNQVLDGFVFEGDTYSDVARAAEVTLRRVDTPLASGEPCGVFAESTGAFNQLAPGYPARFGDSGNCDMAAMLSGGVINRGALDVFSNVGPNPKNVERIDYIYPTGIVAALSEQGLRRSGHLVAEKRGNNAIQLAAITALDAAGVPSAFGPLIRVNAVGCASTELCYGATQLQHNYSFLQNASTGEQGFVTFKGSAVENVAMAMVTAERLGLTTGQRYFGFAFFARDVDPAIHDLVRPETFPVDTADNFILPGDGADFYGGVSRLYVQENLGASGAGSLLSGAVFVDIDSDEALGSDEAALEGITVSIFTDTNGNGVYDVGEDASLAVTESDHEGLFNFIGVPSGRHFILLDESDPDLPPGLILPESSNPITVDVEAADQTDLDFPFAVLISDSTRPVAVADRVRSPQDQFIDIDALANDIDPRGLGLSIVSVGSAQSGSAQIIVSASGTDQIRYTPNTGQVGGDSFVYTIRDGVGQEATGTVTVVMLAFSDINDNGIDDFIECGCTDIRVIAGLDGVGVGAVGAGLFLIALFGFRTRRCKRLGERS